MPSLLSICLTLLRIAIRTTNVVQGLLIDLHNAVEWLMERQNSSITLSTELQSSKQSLTEQSSSETVDADKVAAAGSPSMSEALPSATSSDFPEISSSRKVFVRLNRQSTHREPEINSEPIIISVGNETAEKSEEQRNSEDHPKTCSTTNDTDTTKDNNSSKLQEYEMMFKRFRNEPGVSESTTNEDGSVPDEPAEAVPLNPSLDSENAGDNSDAEEVSEKPAVSPSPKQVESTPSEGLESSLHSVPNVCYSQICVSSNESNIDVSLGITAQPERKVCKPRLVFKKSAFDIDLKLERNLHLRDYDVSTLREKGSKLKKSPVRDFSVQQSVDKHDIDLQEIHSPVKASPSKRKSGRTPVKTKDDKSKIPHLAAALDQSLSLPRFCVDHSTGNVQWKTDIPRDTTSEPKETSQYKDNKSLNVGDNKEEFDSKLTTETGLDTSREPKLDIPEKISEQRFRDFPSETSTSGEEIQYKPTRDRVPTPPPKFPIAESSTDGEKPEYSSVSAAAPIEFKPISERRPTPAARFLNRPSTDTDEEKGAKYDPMMTSINESPAIAEVKFKSTRERRPTPAAMFVHHEPTSSSGTESGIFSEPNNMTIFIPLREESRPPAFRSPLKSHDNSQNASVRFIDQPLLTKNDRIDIMEKIEFVIKPTCEFIPPEALIYPKPVSRISTPLSTDSDTPENIKYIEKSSQLLIAVSTQYDKQEFCDINSSATEFPASGSPTNTTDSEEAFENKPQLLIKSPPTAEDEESSWKESKTQPSVKFQLPELHIDRESKGSIGREPKSRKPPNETSTSEEENDTKLNKKRRASPGKFYKSPKKFAEATASKIRGYKFSPRKTSSEKKREDRLSCEHITSVTRSLDFELGIQRKSDYAANLQTSEDQKNLKIVSKENHSPRIFEDCVIEKANSQQETSSESEDGTSSTANSNSTSETTSSTRIGDNLVEDSAPEGTELFSQLRTDEPFAAAGNMVDSDEQGSDSAPEGTKGLFPRLANETRAIQENVLYRDSEADSTSKDEAAYNSSVKGSTDSDKSRKISTIGHLEVLDTNDASHESKTLENDELASDQNNEGRIGDGKKTPQLDSASNLHALSEGEQRSNYKLQLETRDSTSNDDNSKISSTSLESSSSEESIYEKSGSDSSNEGAACLSTQPENRPELDKSTNADKSEDKKSSESKSESPKFSTSDKSTNKEFVKDSTQEADTDNFHEPKNINSDINLVWNVDSRVEINTFDIDQRRASYEAYEHTESEEASSSLYPAIVDSLSEDQITETERPLEVELPSFNEDSISLNTISVLSPVYEISANGTTSRGSYSTSETTYAISITSTSSSSSSEEEGEFVLSPLSESQPSLSPKNGHSSSETEMRTFSMSRQVSSSEAEHIQLTTPSLVPAVQSQIIEKETGELNSETETVSSLSSQSTSSNSEVDEENGNVAQEASELKLSPRLNTNLTKDHASKSTFSPVLEELVQRIKSTTSKSEIKSTSPSSSPVMPSNSEVEEVTLNPQICTDFKTYVKKVYNFKSYFDPVLKELVQRVKSNTVSDSSKSIYGATTAESLSADSRNVRTSEEAFKDTQESNHTLTNPEESTEPRVDENSTANNGEDFLKHTEVVTTQTDIFEIEQNVIQPLVFVESCVVEAEPIENIETFEISWDLSTENTFEIQDSTEMHLITSESPFDHTSRIVLNNNNATENKDVSNLIVSEVSKNNLSIETLVSDSSKPLPSESLKVESSESVNDFSIKTSESSKFLICSTPIGENSESNILVIPESSVQDLFQDVKCEDERNSAPNSMTVNLTSVETCIKEIVESDKNHELRNNEVVNAAHDTLDGFSERSVCDFTTGGIIEDKNGSVQKIEVLSGTSIQSFPREDFVRIENFSILELSNDSIQNEKEPEMTKFLNAAHSDNLITVAENIKPGNLEFEMHIVPQPVPCEIAIESKVETLISIETSADQNEIIIVDSKTPENELNGRNLVIAESTTCPPTANEDKNDSRSSCPLSAVGNESTTVEISESTGNSDLSMSSTRETLVAVTRSESTANILVETAKNGFTENTLVEVTKPIPTENTHVDATNSDDTETTLVEVANEKSIENTLVEINEESAENTLVETSKDDVTKNNLVEDSKDEHTENTFDETITDSTENTIVDVIQDNSTQSNALNTSTNLDSSVVTEEGNDNEESSKENKAWKKKTRKSKKKRRN